MSNRIIQLKKIEGFVGVSYFIERARRELQVQLSLWNHIEINDTQTIFCSQQFLLQQKSEWIRDKIEWDRVKTRGLYSPNYRHITREPIAEGVEHAIYNPNVPRSNPRIDQQNKRAIV